MSSGARAERAKNTKRLGSVGSKDQAREVAAGCPPETQELRPWFDQELILALKCLPLLVNPPGRHRGKLFWSNILADRGVDLIQIDGIDFIGKGINVS